MIQEGAHTKVMIDGKNETKDIVAVDIRIRPADVVIADITFYVKDSRGEYIIDKMLDCLATKQETYIVCSVSVSPIEMTLILESPSFDIHRRNFKMRKSRDRKERFWTYLAKGFLRL